MESTEYMRDLYVLYIGIIVLPLKNYFAKIILLHNIHYLAIELFKVKNASAPKFMNDIVPLKNKLLYCSKQDFLTTRFYSVYNVTETLSHLGPKIWLVIPNNEIKASCTLKLFLKVKVWKPKNVHAVLCKPYVKNVG